MPGDSEPTKRAMRAYSPSWRRMAMTWSRCVGSSPLCAAVLPCAMAVRIESAQPCISGVMSFVSGLLERSASAFSTSPLAMLNSASDEVGWRGGGGATACCCTNGRPIASCLMPAACGRS
jgi:hypothetical protein